MRPGQLTGVDEGGLGIVVLLSLVPHVQVLDLQRREATARGRRSARRGVHGGGMLLTLLWSTLISSCGVEDGVQSQQRVQRASMRASNDADAWEAEQALTIVESILGRRVASERVY